MRISISVIIPIFNVEKYVRRCLESVMAQDDANADIECVIVDDCSPDDSMTIVKQMISVYEGNICFKLLAHYRNRGLSAARNTGLMNATGKYVFFIDSDDYLMPDSFQYFLENLERHHNVDMIMGNVTNCKGGNLLIHHTQDPQLLDDCNVFVPDMFRHRIYLYAWNKLIRKDILMNNHILFVEGILYEDQCWSYDLFSHLSSILVLPKVTYVYENNPLSIVNTAFTQEKADLVIRSYTLSTNKMLDKPPVGEHYRLNISVDYLLFMMNYLMNGVDVQLRSSVSDAIANDFLEVRKRLIVRSLKYGRLLLSFFFFLLFPPLCYVQRIHFFRHHYYQIEVALNKICHMTDFLHSKNRL